MERRFFGFISVHMELVDLVVCTSFILVFFLVGSTRGSEVSRTVNSCDFSKTTYEVTLTCAHLVLSNFITRYT